ncbi:mannose-1-phosphate guanylyltransferase/mannose-6-phosphate isomerase [Candidatus Aerophobetes bacterium]|uniref:Mannose-1-phosphate guanylyltransferase/mannose-6-phosphate isomerase n=1 Tax=Aerophobetes bacterium TaxID=2030807 RepID=A0A2A4YKI4_UNCAE|nr:MAG: mannose-1-phosphate guanylyltransferase/mannose-6-phosphate isomerase [Candidatus Aerophobetes bacterium]
MKIIILAGGMGNRLWPVSKKSSPKHLLHFGDGESLLKRTVKRFVEKGFSDDLFIITNTEYASQTKQHLRDFAPDLENRILVEPLSRNTAPAAGWSIRHLLITNKAKVSDEVLIVPCDHVFSNEDKLIEQIIGVKPDQLGDSILSFGISATRPETGFGYIRATEHDGPYFHVDSFIEKPNRLLAEKFAGNDDWYWNTGIYLFKIKIFLEEIKQYEPALFHFMNVESHHEDYVYRSLTSISLDNAIMEKTNKLKMIKLRDVGWSDVGTWDSIYRLLDKDDNGNVKIGNILEKDTKNCLFLGNKKLISAIGIEDLVVIETDEVVFISKREQTQKVKELIKDLHELKSTESPLRRSS